jgi:hypothetical protein
MSKQINKYSKTDSKGSKFYYADAEIKILHREDGPAVEYYNGDRSWWQNGNLHREDGPAVEWMNGDKSWWINNERHREDGPAMEFADGGKWWYKNNLLHREDGPAIDDRFKTWFLNGLSMSEEKFNAEIEKMS